MGKVLDELIESYVAPFGEKYKSKNKCNDEMLQKAQKALISDYQKDVRAEIVSELTEAEKAKIDKKIREYKTEKDLENLRTVVCEGVFFAVIVDILVNQVTDIVAYYKDGQNEMVITWVIVLVLGAIVCGYVLFRLATIISRLLGSKENVDESNS